METTPNLQKFEEQQQQQQKTIIPIMTSDLNTKKSEHYNDLISSLNGQIINSLHNGNWIFLNKRHTAHPTDESYLAGGCQEDLIDCHNIIIDPQPSSNNKQQQSMQSHLAEIQTRVSEKLEQSLKNQSIRSFVSDTQKLQDLSDFFLDNLFRGGAVTTITNNVELDETSVINK